MAERERLRKEILRAYPDAIFLIEKVGVSPKDVATMRVQKRHIRNGGQRINKNVRALLTKYAEVCHSEKNIRKITRVCTLD